MIVRRGVYGFGDELTAYYDDDTEETTTIISVVALCDCGENAMSPTACRDAHTVLYLCASSRLYTNKLRSAETVTWHLHTNKPTQLLRGRGGVLWGSSS